MLNNGLLSFGYIFLLFFCFIFFFFVFFVFFRVDKLCSEEEQVNQQMGRNVTDAVRLYFRFVYWMYTLIVFAFAGGQMQWLSPSESGGRYFALVDFFFIALLKWKGALVSVLLNAHMVHTKFIMRGMECMGYNMTLRLVVITVLVKVQGNDCPNEDIVSDIFCFSFSWWNVNDEGGWRAPFRKRWARLCNYRNAKNKMFFHKLYFYPFRVGSRKSSQKRVKKKYMKPCWVEMKKEYI